MVTQNSRLQKVGIPIADGEMLYSQSRTLRKKARLMWGPGGAEAGVLRQVLCFPSGRLRFLGERVAGPSLREAQVLKITKYYYTTVCALRVSCQGELPIARKARVAHSMVSLRQAAGGLAAVAAAMAALDRSTMACMSYSTVSIL